MNSNCFAIFFSAAFLLSAVQISIYLMQTSGLVPLLYQIKLTGFYLKTIKRMINVSLHYIPSGTKINHLILKLLVVFISQGIKKLYVIYTHDDDLH